MKWIALVLTVLLLAHECGAQTAKTESRSFIFTPAKNVQPPILSITLPPVGTQTRWITSASTVTVKGTVVHSSGIRILLVNDREVSPEASGAFSIDLPLKTGSNDVVVEAISSRGSQAKRKFEVLFDSSPPTIELLEPKPSGERGLVSVNKPKTVIRLRVYDESGVSSVLVNGEAAKAFPDSTYTREVQLTEGANEIVLSATDNSGREAEQRIVVSHWGGQGGMGFLGGKCYALIIGIDKYKGKWPLLQNAVQDARALEDLLRNRFVFDRVITLYDQEATRAKIITALESLLQTLLPSDRLLIYYSGHGDFQKQLNRGYWVPVDALDQSTSQYISNGDIQTYLGGMPANHVLLVADACFAGDIFKGKTEMVPFENNMAYFRKVGQSKSRKALTSGGIEPVVDGGSQGHSVFAFYFLQALNQIEGKYFDASQVYEHLRIPVANNARQTPQFLPIRDIGDAGGEFIFLRK
jgi:hypothetical protein